jgi:uncharacterized membrane protein
VLRLNKKYKSPKFLLSLGFSKPEIFVAIFGAIFGLLFLLLIPPLQGADEPNHFLRAYQVSDGDLVSEYVEKSVGGTLPTNVVMFSRIPVQQVQPGNSGSKETPHKLKEDYNIKDTKTRDTVTFSNTAAYSPVAYFPAAVGIEVGKIFSAKPLVLMYFARLASFAVALSIIVLAIYLLPFAKLPFAVIALIPTTLAQTSTVSADTLMLALCFLAVSLTLRFAFRTKDITKKEIAALIATFGLLSLTKAPLFSLSIFTILLLANPIISRRKALKIAAACIGVALLGALMWSGLTKNLVAYGYHNDMGTSYAQQLHFITHKPFEYARVLYNTFATSELDDRVVSFYGNFGWLDTPIPLLFISIGIVVLSFSIFITARSEPLKISKNIRWVASLTALAVLFISITSQYLFAVEVKKPWVFGVQGRYFIPSLLVLVIAFLGGKRNFSKEDYAQLSKRILMFSVLLLCVATIVIATRYYPLPVLLPMPS